MKKALSFVLSLIAVIGLGSSFPALAADQPLPPGVSENVMKVLKSNKELSKFADMVESAGLSGELSGKDNKITVFAPSNAAMEKLSSDVLKRAKEGKGVKSLAQYHMINGSVVYSGNIKGRRASPSTANGEMMGFDGMGKELKVNESVITTPDLKAMNGVVHIINGALVPESLQDPKIKEEARAKEEKKMKEEMEKRQKEREAMEKEMDQKRAKEREALTKEMDEKRAAETPAKDAKESTAVPVEAQAPSEPAVAAPAAPKAPVAPKADETKKEEPKAGWKKWFGM